ncbi:MAG: ISAs1 family transposase [Verrucomicrobiota bacterium]|nr:ISAs1 family transposase [Verrucomicrobiota bacterium]
MQPQEFKRLINKWFQRLEQSLKDQLLVIDGKRLCGTSDDQHVSHIVELFAAEQRLVIAQEKVNERQALPALLDSVNVEGAIVTMDALFAHVKDIEQVLQRKADYIVGIKSNQSNLEAEARNFFSHGVMIDTNPHTEGVRGWDEAFL